MSLDTDWETCPTWVAPRQPCPTATLGRTLLNPAVALRFGRSARHATEGMALLDWVRALPARRWDADRSRWVVTAFGADPTGMLQAAGFDIDLVSKVRDPALTSLTNLNDLATMLVVPSEGAREVLIYPRLLGFDAASRFVPAAATWDRERQAWRATCLEVAPGGRPLPGLDVPREVCREARRESSRVTTDAAVARQAASVAQSLGTNTDPAHLADLIAAVGDVPAWFGMTPYPYQRAGAIAAAAGHTFICDEPGIGKTVTSLAAAAIVDAQRIVVLCPAKVLTSWALHVERTAVHTGGGRRAGQVALLRTGRKEPPIPQTGVVILSDTLVVSRPELVSRLVAWAPEVLIYDESHRSKSWDSARSQAARQIAAATSKLRIAATGTPMHSSPEELACQLEVTGHLGPIFGGRTRFLQTYCRQNKFKAWVARKSELPALRAQLDGHVCVRRRKADVLPHLPAKTRHPLVVDVSLTEFRAAHRDVMATIGTWLDTLDHRPDPTRAADLNLVDEWARQQIGLMSPLRAAAALAKIPAACEYITDWVEGVGEPNAAGEFERPLVVWVHHRAVGEALVAAAREAVGDPGAVRELSGGTSQTQDDRTVADFQAGKVAVLIASITAAGVGITLTRGCDALFVETSYVVAEVAQAEDRLCRIGQTRPVTCYTMVAAGTLDDRIQQVLARKGSVLEPVLPGGDNWVAVTDGEGETPAQIIASLVWEKVKSGRPAP